MVKQITEQQIYGKMLKYQTDPVGFAKDIRGLKAAHIWDKMREMLEAIAKHNRIAIRAGHSVSKTFTLGNVVVPWFKMCFQPSTIITTAPSDLQVKNQLWREIHAGVSGSKYPLGGRLTSQFWDCVPSAEDMKRLKPETRALFEKNVAFGFSTSPDSSVEHATKIAGWHNKWFMVIMDEACGILPQIWTTVMESLMINERCKVVAIGNPTDPECDFAKACFSSDPEKDEGDVGYMSDEEWWVVTISAMHTPNYKTGKDLIPGLAGRDYVERMRKKHGFDSDRFRMRVRGLFPKFKEGTYYGHCLSKARKDGRIGAYPHDETLPVHTFSDFGDIWTGTIFVQFVQGMIRWIDDYWDPDGLGLPTWCAALTAKGYSYGSHYAGHDLVGSNAKAFQTGKTTRDVAAALGYDIQPVLGNQECSFQDGIRAVQVMFNSVQINEEKCPTVLRAMSGYGKKKNFGASTEEQTTYHDQPAKTWHRHLADAVRHLGIANRFMQIGDSYHGDLTSYSQLYSGRNSKPSDPMDYI